MIAFFCFLIYIASNWYEKLQYLEWPISRTNCPLDCRIKNFVLLINTHTPLQTIDFTISKLSPELFLLELRYYTSAFEPYLSIAYEIWKDAINTSTNAKSASYKLVTLNTPIRMPLKHIILWPINRRVFLPSFSDRRAPIIANVKLVAPTMNAPFFGVTANCPSVINYNFKSKVVQKTLTGPIPLS